MGLLGGGGSSATVVSTTEAIETNLNTADYREAEEGAIAGNLTIATPNAQDSSITVQQTDLASISGALELAGKALDYGSQTTEKAIEQSQLSASGAVSAIAENVKSSGQALLDSLGKYGLYFAGAAIVLYFLKKGK